MKIKKDRKGPQPKERRGFRRLYFDAPGDQRDGVWQWKYGNGTMLVYSPKGVRRLVTRGELYHAGSTYTVFDSDGNPVTPHYDSDDHEPVTPADIRRWIDHYGDEEPPKKCRKKPKQSIWTHNGSVIEITRYPVGEGRETNRFKVLNSAGEIVDQGHCLRSEDAATFVERLKVTMDREETERVVNEVMAILTADFAP